MNINNIKLFIAELFHRKWIIEFDYGFGNSEKWVFDESMNDWGREGTSKNYRGWIKKKELWGDTKCIDNIRMKLYNWALTPEEIKYEYTANSYK